MKLLIKNKIIYFLKKTVKQASEKEWIPNKMEISIKEARLLLKELNACFNINKELRKTFAVKQLTDVSNVNFVLWSNTPLDDEALDRLCEQWMSNDFCITMNHCNLAFPIVVVKECQSDDENNILERDK